MKNVNLYETRSFGHKIDDVESYNLNETAEPSHTSVIEYNGRQSIMRGYIVSIASFERRIYSISLPKKIRKEYLPDSWTLNKFS